MKTERKARPGAAARVLTRGAAALAIAAAAVASVATPAGAWPWSSSVTVLGSVGSCGPSNTSGWGWFNTGDGESGWATWGNGSTFTFRLNRVPTSGSIVTFKWGAGNCSAVRYFVISRPTYGDQAAIGYLG